MKTYVMCAALVCAALVRLGNAQELYWTDNYLEIKRVSLFKERGERRRLVAGPAEGVLTNATYTYLAFDPVDQKLYYTVAGNVSRLYRSELDGTEAQLVLSLESGRMPFGLAIDPLGRKIYWSSFLPRTWSDAKIQRANLDGSGLEDLVTGAPYVSGMALDIKRGKMFWIRQDTWEIWRANLDGSQAGSILTLGDGYGSAYAFSVAVNPNTGQIFWLDAGTAIVGRANEDGSDPQVISDLTIFAADGCITVDPRSETVFWADTEKHVIYAADLDGGRKRVLVSEGLYYPVSLLVVHGNKKIFGR
jgi:hypothetical protein